MVEEEDIEDADIFRDTSLRYLGKKALTWKSAISDNTISEQVTYICETVIQFKCILNIKIWSLLIS